MNGKKNQILNLVKEYVNEREHSKEWRPGLDWIAYSGPLFDANEITAAIDSLLGEWLILGKDAREFETTFPEFMGKKHGSLTNSGSSANLLMVSATTSRRLHNFKPGTKIITPVVGFPTTINPIIQNGFKPVFVDVTLPDLNLDLDQVEIELKKDPSIKGIMFAHVLGNPPDMDRLMSITQRHKLMFLEDACDALGSLYDGKKLGSFGEMSTCSFFPAHHMTLGEGGFVATDSNKIRKVIASMRDWGRACYCNAEKPGSVIGGTACGDRFKCWLPDLGNTEYDHRYVFDEIGYNLKPLELQAAMGLQQLKKIASFDEARRSNFKKLYKIFEPYEEYLHLPYATDKSDPCWFAFLLTVQHGAPFTRQKIVNFLERHKIQTRCYFSGNIMYHPAYKKYASEYDNLQKAFPVAHLVSTNSFFLGTFKGITDDKISYIKNVVDKFFLTVQNDE